MSNEAKVCPCCKKSRRYYGAQVPAVMAEQFDTWRRQEGLSVSRAINQLIAMALSAAAQQQEAAR